MEAKAVPALVIAVVASALVAGAVGLTSASRSDVEIQATQTSLLDDPLAKFGRLMPVFTHPRCVNCHGNINPFGPDPNHTTVEPDPGNGSLVDAQGDQLRTRNQECLGCHDASDAVAWRLAPRRMDFRGRNVPNPTLTLCQQIEAEQRTAEAFREHLLGDPLQVVAFNGTKGFTLSPGRQVAAQDKPPMTQLEFFNASEAWLQGRQDIPCNGWVGTIVQTETVNLTTTYPTPVNVQRTGLTTEEQSATRTITIHVGGAGGVMAEISVSGTHGTESTMTVSQGGRSCSNYGRSVVTYGGKTTGEVKVASLSIGSDGRYTLDITGPDERTTTVERTVTRICNSPEFSDSLGDTFDHPGWTLRISGVAPTGRGPVTRLEGTDPARTVTGDDDRSWFLSKSAHVAPEQMRSSGNLELVPVTVTTTWNLRLEPDLLR
jgi:hypothetical protein